MIVFVTGYTDYCPLTDTKWAPWITSSSRRARAECGTGWKEARSMTADVNDTFFTFQNADGTFKVSCRDILYCYSEKRLVHLVTAQKRVPVLR